MKALLDQSKKIDGLFEAANEYISKHNKIIFWLLVVIIILIYALMIVLIQNHRLREQIQILINN